MIAHSLASNEAIDLFHNGNQIKYSSICFNARINFQKNFVSNEGSRSN